MTKLGGPPLLFGKHGLGVPRTPSSGKLPFISGFGGARGVGSDATEPVLGLALYLIMALGVVVRITVSGPMLAAIGLDWGDQDGGVLTKLHPGSVLLFAAFILWAVNAPQRLGRYYDQHPSHLGFTLMGLLLPLYGAVVGMSGITTYFDTFLAAAVLAPLLGACSERQCRALAYAVIGVVTINAVFCIWECLTRELLFPDQDLYDSSIGDVRGRAFFDAPLAGSMVTQITIFLVMGMRMPGLLRLVLLPILLLGIFGYGGRTGLIATGVGMEVLILGAALREMTKRGSTSGVFLNALLFNLAVPAVIVVATMSTTIGERIVHSLFVQDASAEIRSLVWNIFDKMTLPEYFFGISDSNLADYAYQIGIYFNTEDIENCWLLLFCNLGGIGLVLFLLGFIPFIVSLYRSTGWVGRVLLLSFVVAISGSNSIGRKSNVLILLILAIHALPTVPVARRKRSVHSLLRPLLLRRAEG